MKKMMSLAVFVMAILISFSSCGNDAPSAEEQAKAAAEQEAMQAAKIEAEADSIVMVLDETQQDIEAKTKALEDALEAMENMGQ